MKPNITKKGILKSSFIKSFKELDRRFIKVVLADLLFYAALVAAAIIALKLVAWSTSTLYSLPTEGIDVTKVADLSAFEGTLKAANEIIGKFKSRLALSIISAFILLLVVFSAFKGIPWAIIKKQKLSRQYFMQFFKLNFCWLASITVLLLLISVFTKPSIGGLLVILILILAGYLLPISYAVFLPNEKTRDIFKKTYLVGIENFYVFIIPTLLASAILLPFIWAVSFARFIIPEQAIIVLLCAVLLLWLSWLKYYLYSIMRGIR